MSSPETPPPGDERTSALSGVQRAGIVLVAIAVLLIAFVVVRGGDDSGSGSSASNTTTQTATTSGGGSSTATTGSTDDSSATTTGDSTTGATTGDDSRTTGDTTTGASGSESGSTPAPAPAPAAVRTIRIVNGQPQGGVKTFSYKKGDRIRLKVQSDVADEIHVHGYDLKKNVTAGGTVQFTFPATIEGRFEVELEQAHTQIAQLEVAPS